MVGNILDDALKGLASKCCDITRDPWNTDKFSGSTIFWKEFKMPNADAIIAIFPEHQAAEIAVKKLIASGFIMKNLSVVGQGYHTEEKVVGFYNAGDRIKFWGARGAFWGGLWGLFLGGLYVTVPAVGSLVVLGYLAAAVLSSVETAVTVGGLSALGAALFSIGIPKDSVIRYEGAVKADGFLVMAHGTAEEVERAKSILATVSPSSLDIHPAKKNIASTGHLASAVD